MRVQRVLAVAVVLLFWVSLGFGQGRTEHFAYPITGHQNLGSCGDFDVLVDYAVIIKGVVIFDKEGQWVRELDQVKVIGQDMYYNSTNPDLFLIGGPGEVEVDITAVQDSARPGNGC